MSMSQDEYLLAEVLKLYPPQSWFFGGQNKKSSGGGIAVSALKFGKNQAKIALVFPAQNFVTPIPTLANIKRFYPTYQTTPDRLRQ